MLRKLIFILLLFYSFSFFGQKDKEDRKLANTYFVNGEFEKATSLYEILYNDNNYNTYYLRYLLKCYHATSSYKKAEEILLSKLSQKPDQSFLDVELGYLYQLQHQDEKAEIHYQKAFQAIKDKPASGYQVAKSFNDNHLLDYALQAYQFLTKELPRSNYGYQIAQIYGEKGDFKGMFNTYLDMADKGKTNTIKRYVGRFITDDSQNENNITFRRLLIKRLQENPKDDWNQLLSWLYLQQKEYAKALRQEKAIHLRSNTDLNAVIDVGLIAFESGNYNTVQEAFEYVIANTTNRENQVYAAYYLLESERKTNSSNTAEINRHYLDVLDEYGTGNLTNTIQISYADFLTFDTNEPEKAIEVLNIALENQLSAFQKAEIKIQLGDIMVFTGKYNQALVTFSQIQTKLKNHRLAHKARYKVAQTSYFKGDFDWANTQLKVLKRGTTKLIANDALDLSLLISDNIAQDSVRTALKSYATAELLSYQNKNKAAIDTLTNLLKKHKGHPIEDEALFMQAGLFENNNQLEFAAQNYLDILEIKENDILIDDALFYLAELYDYKLNLPEKAEIYYEKIVLDYASSIYLVPARKRYRKLRGDVIVP
jgi:tetratricopeptide (TPR) repeat protein